MRAAHIVELGEPDQAIEIVDLDKPEPTSNEVRLKVEACALNHKDIWARVGHESADIGFPRQTGTDISGIVDATGDDVTRVSPGDHVNVYPRITCGHCQYCLQGEQEMCLNSMGVGESPSSANEVIPGGLAEYIILPQSVLSSIPPSMSFSNAAAWPVTFTTAWRMVTTAAKLRPSDTVLIHGASGGVGNAALQIADLIGATTYTTTSSSEKASAISPWSDRIIDYSTVDFSDKINELTDGQGVDVIVDHIGKETWEENIRSLSKLGQLVVCGATTGATTSMNIRSLYSSHRRIIGETFGNREEFREVGSLIEREKLKPQIYRELPLDKIYEGHRLIEQREVIGKIVIRPNGSGESLGDATTNR